MLSGGCSSGRNEVEAGEAVAPTAGIRLVLVLTAPAPHLEDL